MHNGNSIWILGRLSLLIHGLGGVASVSTGGDINGVLIPTFLDNRRSHGGDVPLAAKVTLYEYAGCLFLFYF